MVRGEEPRQAEKFETFPTVTPQTSPSPLPPPLRPFLRRVKRRSGSSEVSMARSSIFLNLLMFSLFLAGHAYGETWSARCDTVHVKFNRKTMKADLFLQTKGGVFQVATGKIAFDNDVAMRAPMEGLPEG